MAASIKPASQAGQMIHASLSDEMACVNCHRNLVHSRPGSLSAADEVSAIKRATQDAVHSPHLANIHLQKGLSCATCHGNDLIPDAARTAINALVGVMRSKNATHAARVSAANAILDRGWGRPPQALENGVDGALELIHRIERVIVHPENSESEAG